MKKIYLIDWNSFIYRMFFALPEFATKEGEVVNALFWMAKFFVESLVKQNPDYLIFIKDARWENFRHKIYKDYKATRDKMPDNLRTQIKLIEEMIIKMWIDIVEIPGYEADDAIWTFSQILSEDKDNQVYILSGDKDLYSLVCDNVFIYDTMKRKIFNPEKTKEKFWIEPKMIIDYLAIVWDKADNIPWIDWFWPKKAVELINNIWSVEKIFKEVEKVINEEKSFKDFEKSIQSCFKWKTFEKLLNSQENAFLSKQLATIELNIDLEKMYITNHENDTWIIEKKFELKDFIFKKDSLKNQDTIEFFKKYEFHSLVWETEEVKLKTWWDFWLKVKIIDNQNWLDNLLELIKKQGEITLDTETTWLNIMEAQLVWISIYIDKKNIYYINRLHDWWKINDENLRFFLEKILNLDILIIWHNLKYDLEIIDIFLENILTTENNDTNHQMSLL